MYTTLTDEQAQRINPDSASNTGPGLVSPIDGPGSLCALLPARRETS